MKLAHVLLKRVNKPRSSLKYAEQMFVSSKKLTPDIFQDAGFDLC